MKRNSIILLAILLLTVSLVGCKSSKSLTKSTAGGNELLKSSHGMTTVELVQKMQLSQPAFRTANVKKMTMSIDFKGKQMEVKASCKMVTDSAIHLSIQPFFGVELFKIEMTPASIILIDKMNGTYYESNYALFSKTFGVPVNFKDMQSLISNRLFIPGEAVFSPDNFQWKNNEAGSELEYLSPTFRETVSVNSSIRIAKMDINTSDSTYTLSTQYLDFKNYNGTVFPEKIYLDAINSKDLMAKTSMHVTIDDVTFDEPLKLEPANLMRYQRGNINSFFSK